METDVEEEDQRAIEDTSSERGKKRKIVFRFGAGTGKKYDNFTKPGYNRNYSDTTDATEFPVFIEGTGEEKIGNKNPLAFTKLFKNIKGIHEQRRVNANKIMLVFKNASTANDFLKNKLLEENNLRAFIPTMSVESIGVVRYIPTETSNEELFHKLSADQEIVGVRRFKRKDGDEVVPLGTISVTFVGTTLPEFIYLDNWRYRVYKYIPPIKQCYRCLGFNHEAKNCRKEQVCSRCSGEHNFKECTEEILKCINCGGTHLAISKDCPYKKNKIEQSKKSYANTAKLNLNKDFPSLKTPASAGAAPLIPRAPVSVPRPPRASAPAPSIVRPPRPLTPAQKVQNFNDIIRDDKFVDIIVKTLVSLGNSNSVTTVSQIRETFLKICNT